jgi:SAM-dependent methyltransferase
MASPTVHKPDARRPAAEWHREALDLYEQQKHQESLRCFNELLAAYPEYQVAYNDLGVICFSLGLAEEARTFLEKAARLAPGQAGPLSNLADVYLSLGLEERALEALTSITDADADLRARIEELRGSLRAKTAALVAPPADGPLAFRAPRVRVDFIAYHDLQAQAAASVFEAMSQHFDCHWMIGPGQVPSGGEVAVLLDHCAFQPQLMKSARGYRQLVHMSHDLADLDVYRAEAARLTQFDLVLTPSAKHAEAARAALGPNVLVRPIGWPKFDRLTIAPQHAAFEAELRAMPQRLTVLYGPTSAWTYEWKELLPLLRQLPINLVVKNHIYVNPGQPLPPGNEENYRQALASIDEMEAYVRAAGDPGWLVAPRTMNSCSVFPFCQIAVSDTSSLLVEFLPFGLAIETGRHNRNSADQKPEISPLWKEVRFFETAELHRVLGSMPELQRQYDERPAVDGNSQLAELRAPRAGERAAKEIDTLLVHAVGQGRGPALTISPSNVDYSDGSEDAMLTHFMAGDVDEYQHWDPRVGWSPYYNLSPIRKNLFNWMDFGEKPRSILELGAGCGAITSHLVTLPHTRVVAVEGAVKRAQVTQARCRQAENLEIHACNIDSFAPTETFDVITLIGVLEYAGLYTKQPEPFRLLLRKVRQWLKPDGCLILAIENQLGHRYIAGMQEDHYHHAFEGINDYPDYNGIRTFDAATIRALLAEAGMPHQGWYYPYPDYKMPEVVVSEEALTRGDFDHLALFEFPTIDASTKDRPRFNERAFLEAMGRHGSVGHLMNSFLVLASPDRGCELLERNANTLAAKLNVRRHRHFQHRVKFVKTPEGSISVERSRLHPGAAPASATLRHEIEHAQEPYLTGTECLEPAIITALLRGHVRAAARLVGLWEATLRQVAAPGTPELEARFGAFLDQHVGRRIYEGAHAQWVPGECLDLQPGNILYAPSDKKVRVIDLEWKLSVAMPLQMVFDYGLRKLVSSFSKMQAYLPRGLVIEPSIGLPRALLAELPATSLLRSTRLADGDVYLSWLMSGILGGDLDHRLGAAGELGGRLLDPWSLCARYAADPDQADVVARLRALRHRLVNELAGPGAGSTESVFHSPLGKSWHALRGSLFLHEPLLPDETALADALQARLQSAPGDLGALTALMLYRPAHLAQVLPRFRETPAWLRADLVKYVFRDPTFFRQRGEADAYAAHYRQCLERLAAELDALPAPAARELATLYANHASLLPLYFAQGNTRDIYRLRAQVLELALTDTTALELPPAPAVPRTRLRVGFLNAHLGPQTETYSTLPTFEGLDRSRFEVVLFTQTRNGSSLESYARGRADRLVELGGTVTAQVERIRQEELDIILIGTNVTAVTNQMALLALHRLARVQLLTNSSPVTSGMRHMDGYITGTLTTLPTEQAHFTEKLLFLDGPAHCFNYQVDAAPARISFDRQMAGIAADAVVFVSGANFFKLVPELQDTWARILAAVPGSRLLLHPFNPNWSDRYPIKQFMREVRGTLARRGVRPEQLIISSDTLPGREDVKRLLALGDVYLDSYPFAGVNSTVDPLELGMPVVCREADTFRSRMAGSLLRELGVPDLVVTSEEAYFDLAVRLATDAAFRAEKHRQLEAAMRRQPRFLDPAAYGREMGKLLERAFAELGGGRRG